jgi:predicted nucleic acid-binding protein
MNYGLELRPSSLISPRSQALKLRRMNVPRMPSFQPNSTEGEASVIRLGLERTDTELLIDERKARRIASSVYMLRILGTGGVLLRAKRRKILPAIKPILAEIIRNGYFISERLEDGILREAGEV